MEKSFVVMTDKSLSGWGKSQGKINKLIFTCDNLEQAEIVQQNAKNRSDMKFINITRKKPEYDSERYYVQEKNINEYPKWYEKDAF